jgi:hypothetical protein
MRFIGWILAWIFAILAWIFRVDPNQWNEVRAKRWR